MDSGSRTMYSLHLVTCSFTRVRCVPKRNTTGGKTSVQTAPFNVAAATTTLVEKPRSLYTQKVGVTHDFLQDLSYWSLT